MESDIGNPIDYNPDILEKEESHAPEEQPEHEPMYY